MQNSKCKCADTSRRPRSSTLFALFAFGVSHLRLSLDVPDAFAVEERDDAVFAHLQRRTELTGSHRRRGARALDHSPGFEMLGRGVAKDRAGGEEAPGAIGDGGAVER